MQLFLWNYGEGLTNSKLMYFEPCFYNGPHDFTQTDDEKEAYHIQYIFMEPNEDVDTRILRRDSYWVTQASWLVSPHLVWSLLEIHPLW